MGWGTGCRVLGDAGCQVSPSKKSSNPHIPERKNRGQFAVLFPSELLNWIERKSPPKSAGFCVLGRTINLPRAILRKRTTHLTLSFWQISGRTRPEHPEGENRNDVRWIASAKCI